MFVVLEKAGRDCNPVISRVEDSNLRSCMSVLKQRSRASGAPKRRIQYSVEDALVSVQLRDTGVAENLTIVWPAGAKAKEREMMEFANHAWAAFINTSA